jgi:hypothetical protein
VIRRVPLPQHRQFRLPRYGPPGTTAERLLALRSERTTGRNGRFRALPFRATGLY